MNCSVQDCTVPPHAKGVCKSHYIRAAHAERTLRRGGTLNPPHELPYRSLARSCPRCGELMTTPPHLLRKDAGPIPKCGPCQVRAVVERQRRRLAGGDEALRVRMRNRTTKNTARAQRELAATARHSREEWTGPQLEVLAREDLTAREVAAILGRTLYAVRDMRRRIKTQPREQWLAGQRSTLYQGAAR